MSDSIVKLNFGSGDGPLEGWINVDYERQWRPDVAANLADSLPFTNGSVDFIHSEDFIDQLTLDDAFIFLKECHRILKPGGVARILTPDLKKFAQLYLDDGPELKRLWDFVGLPLKTSSHCEIFNIGMRMAGHTFLYDAPTFERVVAECGLTPTAVKYNQSDHAPLRDIDLRSPEIAISMYYECTKRG